MRIIAVQGLGDQRFERDVRDALLKEMPAEAEVYVFAKPGAYEVEIRVGLQGSSATRTISFLDPGELTTGRILEAVRELVSMLPTYKP